MKTDRILTGLLIFTMVHWMGLSKVFAYNQAIYLNGTDNYIEIPHDDDLNLYDNMAITIWIKVTDFNTPYAAIVTKGESSWAIQRYNNTDFIQVIYGEDSIVGTTSVNDGKWHHIAATYNTHTLKLYIDGELDASKWIVDPYFSINENPVCIGTSPEHPERLFHGVVDELRIWEIYQVPGDIRAHMNVELTGSNWGLVAYYRMDNDSDPSHIVDFTGHGHTGILQETWVTAYVNTGVIFAKVPKAGDGSAGNPYQIDSIGYLFWITRDTGRWNKHYVQTADIDASATESLYGGKGFLPVGDETVEFSGSYQGNDFNIDGLYINRPDKDSVGLFGNALGVDLNNILLTDADITGGNYVGGIAGIADDSSELNKCTFSGSLAGTDKVGAMAGMASNGSTVQNCLNAGSVSGEDQVGGIVGDNISGTYISRCCNQGTVSATGSDCGGVAGSNHSGSYVINSYSTGSVSGNDAAGGLLGNNGASVESCYSSGAVSATTSPGGLVGGSGSGTVLNSFWDTQSSGQASSNGGTGKASNQMKDIGTYTIVNAPELTTAWDFVNNANDDDAPEGIWNIDQTTVVNAGYPIMTWQAPLAIEPSGNGTISEPYLVSNLNNLVWITENDSAWEGFFEQVEDVPAGDTWGWDDRSGLLPIGNSTTAFDGHYNGDGYSIEDLFINRGSTERVGFFGNLDGAEIENLIITGADITGSNYTGVLAGYAAASDISYCGATGTVTAPQWAGGLGGYATVLTIQYCYADVDVTGESDGYLPGRIGGLVGYCNASSAVKNCYARGNIYGEYATGGLVGSLENSSVENSFSSGDVSTNGNDLGGLIGLNASSPVTNSFWDTQTSNHSSSAGGTGKTTAEMKRSTTFLDAGWDFTLSGDIWAMNQDVNSGYPFLRMQGETPAHVWLGIASKTTDWGTAGNWSENSTPGSTNNVIIADVTNDPTISSDPSSPATCDKMTIEPDATLTISSGKALTIEDELLVDGSFLIKSDGTDGTGSLIVNGTASGNVSLQRYIAELSRADAWHYVTASVSGQALDDAWMDANNISVYNEQYQFYRWDEDTDYWIYYDYTGNEPENFGDNTFVDARAYTLTASGAQTLSFTGTVITENTNYAATYTSNKGWGWNLVGNPFTSTIAITEQADADNNFLEDNAAIIPDSYEAIYVWDEQSGYTYGDNDYKVICNTGFSGEGSGSQIDQDYVTPGQGFMVKVNTSGNIVFNEDIRKHGTADFYKEDESWPGIELGVKGNDHVNSTIIAFHENMTRGLDPSYDAVKLKGNPDLALYSKLLAGSQKHFAIQALPFFEEDYSIPVGLDITQEGNYIFEVVCMELIPDEVHVYLEDLKTGTVSDLKKTSTYTCLLDATGSITDRFLLHFTLTPFGEEELQANESPIQIWANNKTINLYNHEQQQGTIRIFNLYGQQIMQTRLNGNQQQRVEIEVPAAYYLVNVISVKGVFSKKVFVN